jgi:cytochrome P450
MPNVKCPLFWHEFPIARMLKDPAHRLRSSDARLSPTRTRRSDARGVSRDGTRWSRRKWPARCPVTEFGRSFEPFNGDPYEFYARAPKHEPVFFSPQLGYWVVTRYKDVRRIFLDSETFSATNALELLKPLCPAASKLVTDSGFHISPSMVVQDPPIHTVYRRLWRKPFTAEEVAKLEPRVRTLIARQIESFAGRGKADLVTDFMFEVPARVIFSLIGVPDAELEAVRKYAKRNAEFGFDQPTDQRQVELAQRMVEYWEYAKQHVERLIAKPQNDLMSQFIKELQRPENTELWDRDYLYTIMLQFLFAGHETTLNASAGAFRALLTWRDQWAAICADPSLIPNTVEASLRFYPSFPTGGA